MYARFESLETRTFLSTVAVLGEAAVSPYASLQVLDGSGDSVGLPIGEMKADDSEFAVSAGSIYARTRDALYQSDGTAAGTQKIAGDDNSMQVKWLGVAGGNLYFIIESQSIHNYQFYGTLYRLNGNTQKWAAVPGLTGQLSPTVSGGELYIQAATSSPSQNKYY